MSMHLVDCAAKLQGLNPSTKLAFMAFADSADRHTHIGLPGLENVMLWACVKRARANEIVAELVDLGLLVKHRAGHRGRRAEYVVFPNGCCNDCTVPTATASTTVAPSSVEESTPPAPIKAGPTPGKFEATPLAAIERKGATKGLVTSGPLPSFPSIPPNPQASPGGASCAKHPNGHPNCRACGTTTRQVETAIVRQARASKREREIARRRQESAARAAGAIDSQAGPVQQLLEQTRKQLAGGAA